VARRLFGAARFLATNATPVAGRDAAAGRDGIARALYVTASERRVVILRVFRKKTRRTPRREIELRADVRRR
jgi:Phage derived protein Gp49-like (DUF891)